MANKRIHIIGGGTVFHVSNHLALCSPAYGKTVVDLYRLIRAADPPMDIVAHLTKMAKGAESEVATLMRDQRLRGMADFTGDETLETNADVATLVGKIVNDPRTKMVFMPVALCDYEGYVTDGPNGPMPPGKYQPRLNSRDNPSVTFKLLSGDKIISRIRESRKDIFLVGFKTTCGAREDEQYRSGLSLLKRSTGSPYTNNP
jgi:hypothetical protein